MSTKKLTDRIIRSLKPPEAGEYTRAYTLHYDSDASGFGVRVTKAGVKSFIFQYRTKVGT